MLACEFAVLGNCYGHTSEKECIFNYVSKCIFHNSLFPE